MDKIFIKNLEVFAYHGVHPEENVLGQKFVISAELLLDLRRPGRADDLSLSVNYSEVCRFIDGFFKNSTFKLIESAAEALAEALLLNFNPVNEVRLRLEKPWAPIGLPVETVGIEIKRSWHRAYIAIGSNIGDKKGFLDTASDRLRSERTCRVLKVSDYIITKPYGGVEQDDFLNGALEMDTLLSPAELLDKLHEIENEAGRKRVVHWGPRTLDLDILMYDDLILDTPELTIPHPEMHLRDFVLEPLCGIAPYLRHPVLNKTVLELRNGLTEAGSMESIG